jgi:hypothetical protein
MKLKMKKKLIFIIAILGIFHSNLLAQPVSQLYDLKPWQQSSEQNEAALSTLNKAFDVNNTSDGNIKLDSIIALKRQLEYLTYDSQGHLISDRIYVSYDPVLNLFNSGYENLYTYANGFIVTLIHNGYDYENNTWNANYKAEYTNDVQGHQTSYTLYDWNTIQSTWDARSKYVYTYDQNGNKTLENDSVWNQTTSKFDNSNKYEFEYDANGNQTLKTTYNWRTDLLAWSISSKNESTYDANGNITLSKNYSYNNTGLYYLSSQSEYTYDADNLITIISYYGSYGSTTLTLSTKIEYNYDTNGNRTQEIDSDWFLSKQIWTNNYKRVYTYDPSVNAANVLWPLNGVNWIKNKITSFQNFPWYNNQWEAQPLQQYYYSGYSGIMPLAIEKISTNNNSLFLNPNPFAANTTISYKVAKPGFISLKIFDAMGIEVASLVNEKKPSGEYSVDWKALGLTSGIYFCRLQAGSFVNTKKFILQK